MNIFFDNIWESLVAIDIGCHRFHVELPERFFNAFDFPVSYRHQLC